MTALRMLDQDLEGMRVLIRQDLNVPVHAGQVASDARIRASLPTIESALNAGGRVMLMSHLGRPTEGQFDAQYSLAPVANHLSNFWDLRSGCVSTGSTASIFLPLMWCCVKTCVSMWVSWPMTPNFPKG